MRKEQFVRTIFPDEEQEATVYRAIDFTTRYINRYYNIFFGMLDFKSDAISPQLNLYLKRKFWADGTVAVWKMRNTDLLGAAQYATSQYDMYDFPATVTLVNKHKLPAEIIPQGEQVVNRDVVVGFFQANQKSVYQIVRDYAEQLSDIDNVINTNLQLQKLPFIICCEDDKQAQRMKNTIMHILNNDVAIEIPAGDKNSLQVTPTAAPYIIDKLYQFRTNLENELKTYLGLDNNGGYEKRERMLTDEINSQRATVTDSCYNFHQCMEIFTDEIKKYLGIAVTVDWSDVSGGAFFTNGSAKAQGGEPHDSNEANV